MKLICFPISICSSGTISGSILQNIYIQTLRARIPSPLKLPSDQISSDLPHFGVVCSLTKSIISAAKLEIVWIKRFQTIAIRIHYNGIQRKGYGKRWSMHIESRRTKVLGKKIMPQNTGSAGDCFYRNTNFNQEEATSSWKYMASNTKKVPLQEIIFNLMSF